LELIVDVKGTSSTRRGVPKGLLSAHWLSCGNLIWCKFSVNWA
jgi:hypothetical protein